jgi:hypothetical protein
MNLKYPKMKENFPSQNALFDRNHIDWQAIHGKLMPEI